MIRKTHRRSKPNTKWENPATTFVREFVKTNREFTLAELFDAAKKKVALTERDAYRAIYRLRRRGEVSYYCIGHVYRIVWVRGEGGR